MDLFLFRWTAVAVVRSACFVFAPSPSSPWAIPLSSHSKKNLILCLHTKSHYKITSGGEKKIGFWLRTSKQRSPSISLSVLQNLLSCQTLWGPEWQLWATPNYLLPLHVGLLPCAGFVCSGDGQLRGTAGHSLGGPDLPPWRASLPASTLFTTSYEQGISLLWLLLYMLSDSELGAGVSLNKSRINQDARLPTAT